MTMADVLAIIAPYRQQPRGFGFNVVGVQVQLEPGPAKATTSTYIPLAVVPGKRVVCIDRDSLALVGKAAGRAAGWHRSLGCLVDSKLEKAAITGVKNNRRGKVKGDIKLYVGVCASGPKLLGGVSRERGAEEEVVGSDIEAAVLAVIE